MYPAFGLSWRVRWAVGALLAACAQLGAASVVHGDYSLGGTRQGTAGSDVTFIVREPDVTGYNGAQLGFTFDPALLNFVSASTTYGDAFAAQLPGMGGLSSYSLFLTVDDPAGIDGAVDLFTLVFNINPGALPGVTSVDFTNDFASSPIDGTYDRASLTGTITIVSEVPIVGTLPLAATALVLLVVLRRRAGARSPAPTVRGA